MVTTRLLTAFGVAVAGLALVLSLTRVASADPGVIYVDPDAPGPAHDGSSWTTAFIDLQSALDAASAGDEVWVAEGVYKPTDRTEPLDARTATFVLTDGVALYGGFAGHPVNETSRSQRDWEAHVTVLSGDLDGNDTTDITGVITDFANIVGANAYHVVSCGGVTETAMLNGFTVTGGKADGSDPHDDGGGMRNDGGSPRVYHVTFRGNSGGGMYNSGGAPRLARVAFIRNGGGGMENIGSDPWLVNAAFAGNRKSAGGGMYNYDSDPSLTNVVFVGNMSTQGGGVYNEYGSSPTMINVTFAYNLAVLEGGGMFEDNAWGYLYNCIFWGNVSTTFSSTDQAYGQAGGGSFLQWSLVQGGCPPSFFCTNLLQDDPLFVRNPDDGGDEWGVGYDDYGDLHLQRTSPAIDAGDNTAFPTGITTDRDGNPRFLDVASLPDTGNGTPPIIDMGAYEAAYFDVYLPLVIRDG